MRDSLLQQEKDNWALREVTENAIRAQQLEARRKLAEHENRAQSEAATLAEWQQEQKAFDRQMVDSRGAALLHVDRLEARLSLAERRHYE
eukprot:12452228-Prorocentrum_lima.AAC.1